MEKEQGKEEREGKVKIEKRQGSANALLLSQDYSCIRIGCRKRGGERGSDRISGLMLRIEA